MGTFREALTTSKHIIAVAGAGLSAASGIPTFRGAGGLWRKHNAMSLATPEAFNKNPSLVWQFYHYRREMALKAHPNAAHEALAQFSFPSVRQGLGISATFHLITQNVDGLSGRALEQLPASEETPSQPLEMHGKLFDVVCTSEICGHREFNTSSPICEGLRGTEVLVDSNAMDPTLPESSLPRCSKCDALARPGVVWFGEMPQHLEIIDQLVDEADMCIVVGTSSTVYPAAGYAYAVQEQGGKTAVFNLDRSNGDDEADFLFLGPCDQTLPQALGLR